MLLRFFMLFLLPWTAFAVPTNQQIHVADTESFEGELEVLIYDNFSKESKIEYYLKLDDMTESFQLEFDSPPKEDLLTGMRINVVGHFYEKNHFKVESFNLLPTEAPREEGGIRNTEIRNTVYLLVDFKDVTTGQTPEFIASKMDFVRQEILSASFQKIDFVTDTNQDGKHDVFGPFVIDQSKADGCKDPGGWATKALEKAAQAGVNLSLYRHRAFILPPSGALGCGWAGLGHVGCGNTCNIWVTAPGWNLVYPHELGHNLGMNHASTDLDNNGTIDSEYGDNSCPMGSYLEKGHFNGAHTWQMGFLPVKDGNVLEITAMGTYRVAALSQDPLQATAPQVLRIANESGGFYYFSYRPKLNLDVNVPPDYAKGISIHSLNGGSNTRYIHTLDQSEKYAFGTYQITQRTTSEPGVMEFDIGLNCLTEPNISFNPGLLPVYPGQEALFSMTFKNTQATNCSTMTFDLTSVLPAGFTATTSDTHLELRPQEEKKVDVHLNTTLKKGLYDFSINATQTQDSKTSVKSFSNKLYVGKTVSTHNGLNLKYYQGTWDVLPDFSKLPVVEETEVPNVTLGQYRGKELFGVVISGFISIPKDSTYKFYLASDDGSQLFINNQMIINNDGTHGTVEKSASITLSKGFYPIRVSFFDRGGPEELKLYYSYENNAKVEVPTEMLVSLNPFVNTPPTVNAGADFVINETPSYAIQGSASDEDGQIAQYTWTQISGPAATMTQANQAVLMLKTVVAGTYVFRLTVTDNEGGSSYDEMQLTVNKVNQPPKILSISPKVTIKKGTSTLLTATATDDDGYITSIEWRQMSGPSFADFGLVLKYSFEFQPPSVGVYVVRFKVTDNQGLSATKQVQVSVIN